MFAGVEEIGEFITKTDTWIAYPPIWYISGNSQILFVLQRVTNLGGVWWRGGGAHQIELCEMRTVPYGFQPPIWYIPLKLKKDNELR